METREWLEVLSDGGRHDDPELHAEHEQDKEAPVTSRLAHASRPCPPIELAILAGIAAARLVTRRDYSLVTHANVKNAIKLRRSPSTPIQT